MLANRRAERSSELSDSVHRSKPLTLSGAMSPRKLHELRSDTDELLSDGAPLPPMPRTWGECKERFGDDEPCPYVRCRHHLALEVCDSRIAPTGETRAPGVKVNFPHLPVWQMPETCSLRAAEQHQGMTLSEVSAHLNVTKERCRQLEASGLEKIRNQPLEELH